MSEKATCMICKHQEHILVQHVQSKHKLEPLAYLNEYPGAVLWSAYGLSKIREQMPVQTQAPRQRERVPVDELFPDFAERQGFRTLTGKIERFISKGPLTPSGNPHYLFPIQETLDIICILEKSERNRVYIKGPSGTGKTDLLFSLAAKLNAEVLELNADSYLQRSDIVGSWTVRDGATVWIDGVIPLAMKRGYWLIINELDAIDADTMNILKPVLEDPSRFTILERGGEIVHAHPDFRIIATGNTWGRGDNTGLYTNTRIHSLADVRRWSVRILLDYMPAKDEERMLLTYFDDHLEKKHATMFVAVANKVRDAFKAGKLATTLAPSEVINWVENSIVVGNGVHHAARISFINACEPSDAVAITEMVSAVFGTEAKVVE